MEIYLLRHGMSVANEQHLVCGASDYPISATGLAQAERVCAYLSRIPFTRIYTSPLSRATKTIEKLVGAVDVQIEPELAELDTGDVSHLRLDALWAQDERYRQPWLHPDLLYPGGECMNDMLGRIGGWYERTAQGWTDSDVILIVGHEGTLRVILHKLLKQDTAEYPTFPIGNCDHLHLVTGPEGLIRHEHVRLSTLS
ncbi:MAG: histidine phosphatase family protein [Janthinobacterium lividum]